MDICSPSLAPPGGRSHTTLLEHPFPAQGTPPPRLPIVEREVGVWTGCVGATLSPDSVVLNAEHWSYFRSESQAAPGRQPQQRGLILGEGQGGRVPRSSQQCPSPPPRSHLQQLGASPSMRWPWQRSPSYAGKLRHRKDQRVLTRKPRAEPRLLNSPWHTAPQGPAPETPHDELPVRGENSLSMGGQGEPQEL